MTDVDYDVVYILRNPARACYRRGPVGLFLEKQSLQ